LLGCGILAWSTFAGPAAAKTFDCERFLDLDLEMRHLYSWALVEGGIAVRASYQADAIQLAKDGDQEDADGSNFVARAIAEKLRPALHRAPARLTEAIEARCAAHKPNRSITLVFLETIDAWRRQAP
jgi:hypothetical protein